MPKEERKKFWLIIADLFRKLVFWKHKKSPQSKK